MKKLIFPAFALLVLITAASCSKESKLNKKLDGTWSLDNNSKTTLGLPSTAVFEYTFTKDGDGGTFKNYVKFDFLGFPVEDTVLGTYTLIKDEQIVLSVTESGLTEKDTVNITDYSATNMTWSVKDSTNTVSISMTKK